MKCKHEWFTNCEDADGLAVPDIAAEKAHPEWRWITRCTFCGRVK